MASASTSPVWVAGVFSGKKRQHITPARFDEDRSPASARVEKSPSEPGPYSDSYLIKDAALRKWAEQCAQTTPSLRVASYAIPKLPWFSGFFLADSSITDFLRTVYLGSELHPLVLVSSFHSQIVSATYEWFLTMT